ncbi:MAG: hypothetical protein KTR31_05930 [Myxococcales bacterium]|nr:hypothetical protein [Myxococcales bacterium]
MPADPLWDRRGPPADPARAITSVHDFLERCRAWGTDRQIPELLERLQQAPSPTDAAKLHQWTTWVAFLDHALSELRDGTLDPWFDEL